MKKATLLSLLICLLSFIGAKAQTCTIINNTTFSYKHLSHDMDAWPSTTSSFPAYFVPASSTIAFTNTYAGLAGGTPGAGGHFVRSATFETGTGIMIGNFWSGLWIALYAPAATPITSFINPLTGGTCTWVEAYDPITGEHDVTITIN